MEGQQFLLRDRICCFESNSVRCLSSVAQGGQWDVQQHGALLLNPATGMLWALLHPGGLT